MKNLKKLNREDLRSLNGGLLVDCQRDLDCGPTGCAWCTDLRGRRVCLYLHDPEACPVLIQ